MPPADAATPDDAPAAFLTRHRITLRVGSQTIPPDAADLPARVRDAVDRANRTRRFDALPDDLNAELLDPEKALAFLRGLPSVDAPTATKLEDRTLYLNAPELGLGVATAYTPAALAAGFKLNVPGVTRGRIVLPQLHSAAIDLPTLQPRIAAARQATEKFDDQVRQQEHALAQIDTDQDPQAYVRLANTLGETKYRRFQAAATWRNLATAASNANPKNPTLSTDATAAQQAAQTFAVPSRAGD